MASYENPANAAMPYFDEIQGEITPYYQPYIGAGTDSLAALMGQYKQLLSDPGALMNRFGQSFQQGPGYKFAYDQAMNAINNAASSGGMLGSPSHQMEAGNMATGLANQDYYNFIGNILKMYQQGLLGSENIAGMGYGASNELAQSIANVNMNKANMAYLGRANENQANADRANRNLNIAGALGGAAIGFL